MRERVESSIEDLLVLDYCCQQERSDQQKRIFMKSKFFIQKTLRVGIYFERNLIFIESTASLLVDL